MRKPAVRTALCILLAGLLLRSVPHCVAIEFWVSPTGTDSNQGTKEKPLASVGAAIRNACELPRNSSAAVSNEIVRIILHEGTYHLAQPLAITSSVASNLSLTFEASPKERVVLSGGTEIQNWHVTPVESITGLPSNALGHVWVANAPTLEGKVVPLRQLWINGKRAIPARQPNGTDLYRLSAWDKTNQVATIPAICLASMARPTGLETVIDQVWEIAILRVDRIEIAGTNAHLRFKQPESKIEFEHPWPPIIVRSNYAAPFFLANAAEFLDEPGEWFEDLDAGKIYYWPRAGEDMTKAECIAPILESVLNIGGAADAAVSNIHFRGITFAHTTWLRPSQEGHVPLQAGMPVLKARKLSPKGTSYQPKLDNVAWVDRPPAAVRIRNAHHITFENCTFEHTASAALDFETSTHDDLVEGCVFRDIGGNGIQLGKFSDTNVETHLPWNPTDEREICSHEKIANNVFTDCGAEDWGCVGICVGYARNVSIEHNEVFNLPYSGISVGWGWTKMTNALRNNFIHANHIHNVGQKLNDLGGIYTLSAQPSTVVAENTVEDIQPSSWVPDPNHWFYLYADEGSSYMTFRDNWCPSEKFLRNANGPGNVWTNNGPEVSETIKNAAGLQSEYRHLLSK